MNFAARLGRGYFFALALVAVLVGAACRSSGPVANTQESSLQVAPAESRVTFVDNQLVVDGEPVPQLFGAELQYFRIRGGQERNIPKAKVVELWTEALSKMRDAGMNAICFYIPWDFHEYKEGHFDFSGTVDEDGDGSPDYPSRDLHTFFRLIEEHDIRYVMVRPGPYINAEWGFLGFGAIPQWFHEKYPAAHMQSPKGHIAKLYAYHNADLLRHTRLWFQKLYHAVLKDRIGPGQPIFAMQVDNETNFQWQSIHNVDFSPANQKQYREFLKSKYRDLADVARAHSRTYRRWDDIKAPVVFGENSQEDGDWYRFADWSIFEYLKKVQKMWLDLGLTHQDVLFTLAESYNAMKAGLIPSLDYRNDPATGMTTVNLYPKTDPKGSNPLLNNPFKADHDVRVADAANDRYMGGRQSHEWVLGPEIQGGWWRGCEVKPEARQQTYLTTLGHGMKAIFLYYFTEGDNWGGTWEKQNIQKIYTATRQKPLYAKVAEADLRSFAKDRSEVVNQFWQEVSDEYRRKHFFYSPEDKGWAQWMMGKSDSELNDLFFDTPLDKNIDSRPQYFDFIKKFGNQIVKPHGEWLAKAVEHTDPVVFLKDSADHAPRGVVGLDNVIVNTEWSAGLYAYILHAGYNPQVAVARETLNLPASAKVAVRYDYGRPLAARQLAELESFVRQGGLLVNFLEDTVIKQLGFDGKAYPHNELAQVATLEGQRPGIENVDVSKGLKLDYLRAYGERPQDCEPILRAGRHLVAFRCAMGEGQVVQVGASLQQVYNTNAYYENPSLTSRNKFLRALLATRLRPNVEVTAATGSPSDASKVAVFARQSAKGPAGGLWITLKSGHKEAVKVVLRPQTLVGSGIFAVEEIFAAKSPREIEGAGLAKKGVTVELAPYDSKVIFVRAP